ncbi:MAG: RluA family pseudouridine synthase [Gammaproteobacteria bacterium]|nr:RluA family pseudouridine synthase [Gammaproteobacteria bacterium]
MITSHTMPDILYQDNDFIILNKPANLLSVPGRGPDKQDCLSARVQLQFAGALIVHRLDYDTSGIMLMALNKPAQSQISRLFQAREIDKTYIAIVNQHPSEDGGSVDLPMRCDYERRPLQIIDHEQGKSALTHWKILHRYPNATSRVELKPHTGRSHQLRLHMLSLGHPILGDNLYGTTETHAMSPRLLLHASELCFKHPASAQTIAIHSPSPF